VPRQRKTQKKQNPSRTQKSRSKAGGAGKAIRLLAIDIGNTTVVIGLFDGDRLLHQWRLATRFLTADEIVPVLEDLIMRATARKTAADRAVLCSVVPDLTDQYREAAGRIADGNTLLIDSSVTTGLEVSYLEPSAVGADRIVNAVAACHYYDPPAVIVDLGTATTFDVVDGSGVYCGGAIAPGVITSARQLYAKAARLTSVELHPPQEAIGKTTADSLRSGIVFGAVDLIDGMITRICRELKGKPVVIATGGLVSTIAPLSRKIQVVDEALSLKGLRVLSELNS
jgi:type III pantothenate kinase